MADEMDDGLASEDRNTPAGKTPEAGKPGEVETAGTSLASPTVGDGVASSVSTEATPEHEAEPQSPEVDEELEAPATFQSVDASANGDDSVTAQPHPSTKQPSPTSNIGHDAVSDLAQPGLDLLYDVELDATLQFGSKEMLLRDVLELGPGDVVELDRHIAEPVDLVVGDRIIARGEVVVASGNFALRVTEVATPQMRLESIRCLF